MLFSFFISICILPTLAPKFIAPHIEVINPNPNLDFHLKPLSPTDAPPSPPHSPSSYGRA
jgi:hypothetical protein